jgi:hypothetical protein
MPSGKSGETATATATATAAATAPCTPSAILAAAQTAFGPFPAGAGVDQPHCAGGWATAVLAVPGQDSALVVLEAQGPAWVGANLGTSEVCSSAGVPDALLEPLDCGPWES